MSPVSIFSSLPIRHCKVNTKEEQRHNQPTAANKLHIGSTQSARPWQRVEQSQHNNKRRAKEVSRTTYVVRRWYYCNYTVSPHTIHPFTATAPLLKPLFAVIKSNTCDDEETKMNHKNTNFTANKISSSPSIPPPPSCCYVVILHLIRTD